LVITERQTYDMTELLWNRRLLDEPWLSQRDNSWCGWACLEPQTSGWTLVIRERQTYDATEFGRDIANDTMTLRRWEQWCDNVTMTFANRSDDVTWAHR
jgi:hypothetical protein